MVTSPNTPPTTLQIAPSTVLTALPLSPADAFCTASSSVTRCVRSRWRRRNSWKSLNSLRQAIPELTRLIDERRDDRQGDGHEHRDDRDVDRQDGERPADADPLLTAGPERPVGEAHHRRKPHRDDGADIDQHQRAARGPHRRHDDHDRGDREDGLNQAARELAVRRR